jgi:hypothetical protein
MVLVGLGDRLGPENDLKLPKISSSQRVNKYILALLILLFKDINHLKL